MTPYIIEGDQPYETLDLSQMCITFGLVILSGKETSGNPQQPSNTTLPKPTQCREFKNPKIGDPTKAPIRPICGDPSPAPNNAGGFDPRDSGQGFCSFQQEDPLYTTLPAFPYKPETRAKRTNCYGYREPRKNPGKKPMPCNCHTPAVMPP